MPTIDPDMAVIVDELTRNALPVGAVPAEQLRSDFRAMIAGLREGMILPELAEVRDSTIPGPDGDIPVRTYIPLGVPTEDVVAFFHGGGWVVGDLDTAHSNAAWLASTCRTVVVSVDYRLAPEHPFPAAFDDCLAVVDHLAGTSHRWLGVAGDSAGGNLAAAVAGARPLAVNGQLLIFPGVDATTSSRSHRELSSGYILTKEQIDWYLQQYLIGRSVASDARFAVPKDADMEGLPAAVVTSAGFDPLRDDGREYAARLASAGVKTIYFPTPRFVHGWIDMTDRSAAARRTYLAILREFAGLRDDWVEDRNGESA